MFATKTIIWLPIYDTYLIHFFCFQVSFCRKTWKFRRDGNMFASAQPRIKRDPGISFVLSLNHTRTEFECHVFFYSFLFDKVDYIWFNLTQNVLCFLSSWLHTNPGTAALYSSCVLLYLKKTFLLFLRLSSSLCFYRSAKSFIFSSL